MPLRYFDCNKKEDTRLVKCDDTVYKVKVLPQRSLEVGLPCTLQEAHRQIEDVFRAVLYMDQRSVIIKPVHTPDVIITMEKKGWKAGRKLFFQLHGKPLKACPYQFILKVDLKTKTSVKDNSDFKSRLEDNAAEQSHDPRTKSCDSYTVNGSEKNQEKTSSIGGKSSKEIIEIYKNIKTIKDVSSSNSDEITENFDPEKNRQILIEKIRERERKKKEYARKKEELNKIFVPTVNTSTISLNKKRSLYKAEVFCKPPTPRSTVGKHYNTRLFTKSPHNKSLKKTIAQSQEQITEHSKSLKISENVSERKEKTSRNEFSDSKTLSNKKIPADGKSEITTEKSRKSLPSLNELTSGRVTRRNHTSFGQDNGSPGSRNKLRQSGTRKQLDELKSGRVTRSTASSGSGDIGSVRSSGKLRQSVTGKKMQALTAEGGTRSTRSSVDRGIGSASSRGKLKQSITGKKMDTSTPEKVTRSTRSGVDRGSVSSNIISKFRNSVLGKKEYDSKGGRVTRSTLSSVDRDHRSVSRSRVRKSVMSETLYNLRPVRVTRRNSSSVDGDNRSRFRKELKQPVTSKKKYAINQSPLPSEKSYECYSVKPIKRNVLKQNSKSSTPSLKRSGNRMSSKRKMDLQQYRRERTSQQKIKIISPVADLEIAQQSYSSQGLSSSSSSSESEHLLKSGKGRKSYPLKSRVKSLSPYGTRQNKKVDDSVRFKARMSQGTGNQNNSAKCSPKIDLYRPLQGLENESQRLIKLRNTSLIESGRHLTERGRHASRKEIDRHEVEVEEIKESMKLQMMSKSEPRSTSPRHSQRKRKSKFCNIVDYVFQPMKKIFKN